MPLHLALATGSSIAFYGVRVRLQPDALAYGRDDLLRTIALAGRGGVFPAVNSGTVERFAKGLDRR